MLTASGNRNGEGTHSESLRRRDWARTGAPALFFCPTALPGTDLPGTSPGAPDGLHRLGVAKGHVQGDGIQLATSPVQTEAGH